MPVGAIRIVDRIIEDEEEKRRKKAREEAEKWAAERPVPAGPRRPPAPPQRPTGAIPRRPEPTAARWAAERPAPAPPRRLVTRAEIAEGTLPELQRAAYQGRVPTSGQLRGAVSGFMERAGVRGIDVRLAGMAYQRREEFEEAQLAIRRRGGPANLAEEHLLAATSPQEFAEFEEAPRLREAIPAALEKIDVPRRWVKEQVWEPIAAIPDVGDLLEKAGVPPKIAGPLGGFLSAPGAGAQAGFAAAFGMLSDEEQAEAASYVTDPALVAFFPGKTVQAARAAVRASPKVAELAAQVSKSPAFRQRVGTLREALVGRAGEAGMAGKVPKEPAGLAAGVRTAVTRRQPRTVAEYVGGPDVVGRELEKALKPEPVLGMLSDFTPARKLPRWLEDPYIKGMETFTRPAEIDLPAALTPLGRVQRRMTTMGDYYEQIARHNLRATEAKQRLAQVRAAYESQAYRRRITAKARRGPFALTEPPEGLYSKNEIVAAQKAARQAKRELRQAVDALKEADVRRVGEDIYQESLALGAGETEANVLRQFFENTARYKNLDEPFLNLPSWRKRLDEVIARGQGNVPGIVGEVGQDMLGFRAALEETRRPFLQLLDDMQALIEKELPTLEFVGKQEWAGLVDRHGAYYVVTHPEDFRGISPALKALLDEAENVAGARYAILQAIDPKAAPQVGKRYLPQLWDDGIEFLESVRRPRGRPGVERPRTIQDWRPVAASDGWSRELADMTPAELLDYATRASDQAIGDRAFRKVILDIYGTKIKPKAAAGLVRFNNPVFAGWWGPPDVRWMIDAIYEPGPQWTRSLGGIAGAMKNTVFGPDLSIAGYNLVQFLSVGSGHALVGGFNRMLRMLGLGVEYWGQRGLTRRLAFASDGLAIPGAEAPFRVARGTMLKYLPVIRRADPTMAAALDKWTHMQYGIVMGNVRDLVAEGGLVLAKVTGQNLDDPAVRRAIMDAANALTGSSRGALRAGRREIEEQVFASARITRSLAALVGTAGNLMRPGASPTQRILAASAIANLTFSLSAVGWALNKYFGDGQPYNPLPFEWEDGEFKRNRDWGTVVIKGRRYSLVPQKSLMVLMWKATEAMINLDPDALGRAVTQFGFSRLHPALQPVGLAFGFGYVPHSGFWGGGIPSKERVKSAATSPLPVIAQVALHGEEQGFRGFSEEIFGLNSYELSVPDKKEQFLREVGPTLSEDDQAALAADVIPLSVRQMPEWQALENEGLQDMMNNPRTRDYAEMKIDRDTAIDQAGQDYLKDLDGYAYNSKVFDARVTFIHKTEDMDFENKGLLGEYYAATYGEARDPLTGAYDSQRLPPLIERWEAQATSEEIRIVRESQRSVNDPVEAEMRTDRQSVHATGYHDIPESVWKAVAPAFLGPAAASFRNLDNYMEYLRPQLLEGIPDDLDPSVRIAILEAMLRDEPLVKAVTDGVSGTRKLMRDSDPELLRLLIKWGWKHPADRDIEVLTGTEAE